MRVPLRALAIIAALGAVISTTNAINAAPAHHPEDGDHAGHNHHGLTVRGAGRVSVAPDRAELRLGATAQADTATAAQTEVNGTMQEVLAAITKLQVPKEAVRTVDVSLSPVYTYPEHIPGREPAEPRIVGYRAAHSVRVQLDDLTLVGRVIDAAVAGGATNIESLTFTVRDDTEPRRRALQQAVQDARSKARAIAAAMELGLGPVIEANEDSVQIVRPMFRLAERADMSAQSTPVEPGQIEIEAAVVVRYGFGPPNNQPQPRPRPDDGE